MKETETVQQQGDQTELVGQDRLQEERTGRVSPRRAGIDWVKRQNRASRLEGAACAKARRPGEHALKELAGGLQEGWQDCPVRSLQG